MLNVCICVYTIPPSRYAYVILFFVKMMMGFGITPNVKFWTSMRITINSISSCCFEFETSHRCCRLLSRPFV